jgi:type IX secretion system PorP/SprF family membrane protein
MKNNNSELLFRTYLLPIIITLFLTNLSFIGFGQQRAQYTQYIMNNYLLNPASGGLNNYWDVKAGFRSQWTGLEGAPTTMFASANGPIKYPNKRVRNSQLKPHQGIGGYAFHDNTGPLAMTGLYGSYSYHLKLSNKFTASAGAFLGIMQYSLNGNDLTFVQNPNDPIIGKNVVNKILPDASIGIWIFSDQLFFGLSANQIFRNQLQFQGTGATNSQLNYHYFMTTGYKFKISQQLDFIPSTMLKYVQSAPLQFDINARIKYNNRMWAGISYRHQDAIAAIVGIIINNQFEIGYSYDLTTSKLRSASYGSQEIIVGMMMSKGTKKGGKVLCPMDYWN